MAAVQLGLLSLALTVCSYDSVLQECMEDQGVSYSFEVRKAQNLFWGDFVC